MIDGLASVDLTFLRAFYTGPNGLDWDDLASGTAPSAVAECIRPWIRRLASGDRRAPLLLPFVRDGEMTGWYATPRSAEGSTELKAELEAWIGPSYWNLSTVVPAGERDPMAKSMRDRFGGAVYRFTGSERRRNEEIAARIADFNVALSMRPAEQRRTIRPIGTIRGDFERALLAQDEARAEAMIAELRATGRLNEENHKYLDVRLKAGLGYWPQIARNHWLVSTLSDLALPPQSLADVVEALYRTYVDQAEAEGFADQIFTAFDINIARRYPRLFATRRGIRTPRVLKAFLLFERLRTRPDVAILRDLASLLPSADRECGWVAEIASVPGAPPKTLGYADADEAFEDENYDRALDYYLACPLTPKSLSRLLQCITMIGTDEARARLVTAVDSETQTFFDALSPKQKSLIQEMREPGSGSAVVLGVPMDWMRWAEQVLAGHQLAAAEAIVRDAVTNWDVAPFARSETLSKSFAGLIVNAQGAAAALIRQSVPELMEAFFPSDCPIVPATRSIASAIFFLIVTDDRLTGADLELVARLLDYLLAAGLSEEDYRLLISDLEDVQERIGSYAHLPWSLDVCETLAVAPCPSAPAREVRLRFFLKVVADAQGFAHRLEINDLLPIGVLANDFGVETGSLEILRRPRPSTGADSSSVSLAGKKIGIYTLAESAGSRAKMALEEMFPGCIVEVNSDLAATTRLTNLAETADLFVFAWKSSSHAAFDCVQEAMVKGKEPIYPSGKGTASILTAVKAHLN